MLCRMAATSLPPKRKKTRQESKAVLASITKESTARLFLLIQEIADHELC